MSTIVNNPARLPRPRFGPWVCKQRPAGDWVIDQLDRERMRTIRFGTYQTEAAAREILAELNNPTN